MVRRALDDLAYDFDRFELAHFVDYVAHVHTKPITVLSLPMSPVLHGAWVSSQRQEFIIVNTLVQPIHRTHIVLHEIAHLLLCHQARRITHVLPPELLRELESSEPSGRLRLAPSAKAQIDVDEQEAERFVYLIQDRVTPIQRLQELTCESSSIPRLKPITDAMGYKRS